MATATGINPVSLLEGWLLGNKLTPQCSAYVDARIRIGDSFYTRILNKDGEVAAEEALLEWSTKGRMRDLAVGIEPVVRGMLALARTDTKGELAKLVDSAGRSMWPRCYDISSPSGMVVLFNPQTPRCGCSLPGGFEEFAPGGELGLMAVTLQVGDSRGYRSYGSTAAQLGLVILPKRTPCPGADIQNAYTVITVELNGLVGWAECAFGLSGVDYLSYALGLVSLDQAAIRTSTSGGYFDDAVGITDAIGYLAGALPKLGGYFEALAQVMGADHKRVCKYRR